MVAEEATTVMVTVALKCGLNFVDSVELSVTNTATSRSYFDGNSGTDSDKSIIIAVVAA